MRNSVISRTTIARQKSDQALLRAQEELSSAEAGHEALLTEIEQLKRQQRELESANDRLSELLSAATRQLQESSLQSKENQAASPSKQTRNSCCALS